MAKLWQYQVLAEPVTTQAAPPETVTLDKWLGYQPSKHLRHTSRRHTYPYLTHAAITQPGTATGEVTVISRPPNRHKSRRHTYPSAMPMPPSTVATLTKVPVHHSQVAVVVFPRTTLYQSEFMPLRNMVVRDVQVTNVVVTFPRNTLYPSVMQPAPSQTFGPVIGSWYRETDRPCFDIQRNQYLYPAYMAPDPYLGTQPEVTSLDKWVPQKPDIVFDLQRLQHTYPSFFTDTAQLTQAEAVSPDRWLVPRPDVLFDLKRWQHSYPSLYWHPETPAAPAEDVTIDKWAGSRPDYIFRVKRLKHTHPSLFTYQLTTGEVVSVDKWFRETARPVFDLKRQQHTYPHLWLTQEDIETETPIGAFSYQPAYVYDLKRLQYTYPHFFKEPSVLFFHCPPLTDWDVPEALTATDWDKVDPQTTNWTQRAAIDAAVLAYNDSTTDYADPDIYYNGVDQALLDGSLLDPKNTGWTDPSKQTTSWSDASKQSTSWKSCGGSEG